MIIKHILGAGIETPAAEWQVAAAGAAAMAVMATMGDEY